MKFSTSIVLSSLFTIAHALPDQIINNRCVDNVSGIKNQVKIQCTVPNAELFGNGEEGNYNCFNPTDVGECKDIKVKIQYKMMNVNNKIDTTLIAKKTTLNFNGAKLIDLDNNFPITRNENHKENEVVTINTCDRHYVDLTMKLQPIIPNGVEGTIADDQWRNSKCGIGGIISLCGDNCKNTDPPATDEWDTTKDGNYMYNVDEGFPGPRDDFDDFGFDVDGRPRGATNGPKDKDLKDPKAPSMAKDVIVKSPSLGKGSKEPTLGKGTKQPTLGKGTKEPTARNLQSRKGRKVLRA